jgi:hypothetical protein
VARTHPVSFDDLQSLLHRHIDPWPDHRKKGPNTPYRIHDAARGAFGIFFTQSPSFVDDQRTLQQTKGPNNVHPLLGGEQIPCDHQSRKLLDPLAPSGLAPVCLDGCERLAQHRMLAHVRDLDNPRLVALDGTNSLSSQALHGHHGLTRQLTNGPTLYDHAAITPVIVCPGQSQGIALPPESIMPQDGPAKQDCERAAGTRWLATHAARVAPHGVTFLGDALSSNQPLCALGLHNGCHCIFTCKPDAHPTCSERLAFWQAPGGMAEREGRRWNGRVTEVTLVRYLNDVLLRGGDEALAVNGCDITVVHATTGAQRSHNSCISHHRLTTDNVIHVAPASRGRWKIAHDKNTVLKTKGYHLAHHFGPGQQYLAAVRLSLHLLAFLFPTVLAWSDDTYALLRPGLARRQTFFNDIQAFMRYMVFASWDHLINFLIQGLELESQFDTG